MKKALLLTVVMLFSASLVMAQGGAVGIYMDTEGLVCDLTDSGPGLLTYYAVHTMVAGATAVQYAAPVPACMTAAVWLSDTAQFPVTIGNSQSGVAIGYGVCLAAPISTLAINIFGQGLTGQCCVWDVIADPNVPSGQVEVVDCNDNLVFATARVSVFNSVPGCTCEELPTEETTWGGVKALYSE